MDTPTVELDLSPVGNGKVRLNGEDVSRMVSGVRVRAEVGDVTRVVLELPAAKISGKIDARVSALMVDSEGLAVIDAARSTFGLADYSTREAQEAMLQLRKAFEAYDAKVEALERVWGECARTSPAPAATTCLRTTGPARATRRRRTVCAIPAVS
jgi:hypothetical protein